MCVGCGSPVALSQEPRQQPITSRVAAEPPSPLLLSTRDRGETTPHRSREGKILSLDSESLMCVRQDRPPYRFFMSHWAVAPCSAADLAVGKQFLQFCHAGVRHLLSEGQVFQTFDPGHILQAIVSYGGVVKVEAAQSLQPGQLLHARVGDPGFGKPQLLKALERSQSLHRLVVRACVAEI